MLSANATLTPYLRTLKAFFIGFIVGLFVIMILMIPLVGLNEDQLFQPIPSLITSFVQYFSSLFFLHIFLRPKYLYQSVDSLLILKILVLFVFVFLAIDILSTWIKLPSLSESVLDDQFKQSQGIFFVSVVIISPILEELVFRGAILGYLLTLSSKLPALLFSSFLFGLIHFSLDQIVWGSIAGIFLGYAYMKSQNIIVPIFFHMLNNGIYFFLKCYGDTSSVSDLLNKLGMI